MYHRPRIGYGRGHGPPQNALLPPHPHRALIRHSNPYFWRLQAQPPCPTGWQGVLGRPLGSETPQTEPFVEVRLPRADKYLTEPVYLCDRADLLEHFPNIRHRMSGGVLYVEHFITRWNRSQFSQEALHHIFRSFQLRRTSGLTVDIFERARDLLHSGHSGEEFYEIAFDIFVGVCHALDAEGGLGCSEDLLAQVEEFALELKGRGNFGPWNCHTLVSLFAAYSKVFRPTTPRHMDALRALWRSTDIQLKAMLMADLANSLDWHDQRSNAHAMYRALSDMEAL